MKRSIVITGASGFIGRHLLAALQDRYRIFALCRSIPFGGPSPRGSDIHWIPTDVGNETEVRRAMASIKAAGGADYVVHLACYFDFSLRASPEYWRTNVVGTRNVLEHARTLHPKRLIFCSSLVVSEFPKEGSPLDESSAANAVHPYAQSKRQGERLVRRYSRHYPTAVVRPAAIFSDWCEYRPLAYLLTGWLSSGLRSQLVAGKGKSAIPFLHVDDFCSLIGKILERSHTLPRIGCYLASPDECASHRELFESATRQRPVCVPKPLCYAAVAFGEVVGRIFGGQPFQRRWMLRYVDRAMPVNAHLTREALGWRPSPELEITRRLPKMIANLRRDPQLWRRRNDAGQGRATEMKSVSSRSDWRYATAPSKTLASAAH